MSKAKPTKYSISEKVYYLDDNKLKEVEVIGIYVAKNEIGKLKTYYCFQQFQAPTESEKNWIIESRIYKTKKSLLDNL